MSAIRVGTNGKHYTLNNEIVRPRDFLGINGFKFANHIWGWITAGKGTNLSGGQHLSNAHSYIQREVVGNGCRRMRAPIELLLWTGPYFDQAGIKVVDDERGEVLTVVPSHPNIANTLELMNLRVGTGSGFSLTPGMKKLIRMYVRLAREYDIVIEVPVLWTIKSEAKGEAAARLGFNADPPDPRIRFDKNGRDGVSIWNEHVLAAHGVGAYLRQLETDGDGEGEHRVDPGGLNLIVDAMNEYTAHVPEVWDDAVLRSVARRWHEREQPGVPFLISQSGRADQYGPPVGGVDGFDGICLHPPRDGEWAKTGDVMRAEWPNELIDVNESQMGWTEAEKAFWVPLIPKWAGLGSTDMATWERMHENFLANDVYTTFHTKRSMDAGWPDSPQTVVEETIRRISRVSGPVEPPLPRQYRYAQIINQAYREILSREPDAEGLENYNELMNRGMGEANLRESLIRSAEYEAKNPET